MAKKKDKRPNSQKHKENVSKDLRKKRIAKQKENEKRYAYNGGGSRVIERSKTDVGRAPAMRGEPIKSKGFVNTFPYMTGSGQGFFDQRQLLNEWIARGDKNLKFDGFMRKITGQMTTAQVEDFMEANKELMEKAATQQTLEKISKKKDEVKKRQVKIDEVRALLGYDDSQALDREFLNSESARYDRIGNELQRTLDGLTNVKNSYEELPKKRDEVDTMRAQAEGAKKGYIDHLQSIKSKRNGVRGTKNLDKEIDKEIATVEAIDIDNTDGLTAMAENVKMRMNNYTEAGKYYNELVKIRKERENDHAQLSLMLDSLTSTGREDPDKAARIANVKMKIKKNEDIHGDIESIMQRERIALENYHKQTERLMKESQKYMAKYDKMRMDESDWNERMKTCMLKEQFYADLDKEKILQNDFTTNYNLFKNMIAKTQRYHGNVAKDVENLFKAINDGYSQHGRAVQNTHDTIFELWSHIREEFGEDFMREHQIDKFYFEDEE